MVGLLMQIIEASTVNVQDLRNLAHGDAMVLRIPDYQDASSAVQMADKAMATELFGYYANASPIGRVGRSFFETTASEGSLEEYHAKAVEWMRLLRKAVGPGLTPIDRLRLEADEVWPAGAKLARLQGRQMFAGLLRIFGEGSAAEPHQDHFDWDASLHEIYESTYFPAQLAANVYLRLPEEGGELAIWPLSLRRTEYERLRKGEYGVDAERLRAEPLVIKPRLGELIIFNARLVHAVYPPKHGNRVTWSCFIGYRSDSEPLTLWS